MYTDTPATSSEITTPWWKLLLLTIVSAACTYILAIALTAIRSSEPAWAAPVIALSQKHNPTETPADYQLTPTHLFFKWDSYYYVTMAQDGYDQVTFNTKQRHNWAFFPLYPVIIKAVASIPGVPQTRDSFLIIGMILSNIFFFTGLLIWKRLAHLLQLTHKQWQYFLWFLFLFPVSYVFHLVFTESLFFFLSSLAIYLLLKQKYVSAAWITSLTAVTRITGIILIPVLLFSYVRTKTPDESWFKKIATVLGLGVISLTPVALFFNYLAAVTGELLAPLKIQAAWNNDGFTPFSSITGYIRDYGFSFHPDHGLSIILLLISWALIGFAASKVLRARGNIRETHLLLLLLSVELLFINSSVSNRSSIFRYTTSIPYLFIVLSLLVPHRVAKWMVPVILVICSALQIVFFTFFIWKIPLYGF